MATNSFPLHGAIVNLASDVDENGNQTVHVNVVNGTLVLDPTNLALAANQVTEIASLAALTRRLSPAPGVAQNVAIGAAHAESTAVGSTLIRVVATSACHVRIGAAPVAVATDGLLPAGQVEYFMCLATDKVSVLQDSAGGTLNVWPMA
jgi:hypothetical protein